MSRFVLDASIILTWCFPDEESQKALEISERIASGDRVAPVASAILGGWRLAVIYQAQTGLPFTPGLSFDSANAGTVSRPNRLCDGKLDNGTISRYFDTSCFAAPTSYVFGNAGRNILRAPGMNNLDGSLQRDFKMPMEHQTILQFRAEAFNSLNHTQFGMPGATVGNPTYGAITSTSTDARQLQLGVRVIF